MEDFLIINESLYKLKLFAPNFLFLHQIFKSLQHTAHQPLY